MAIRIDVVRDGSQPVFPAPTDPNAKTPYWFTAKIVNDREWQADSNHTWAFSNAADLSAWMNTHLGVIQTADSAGVPTPAVPPQSRPGEVLPPSAFAPPAPVSGYAYAAGTVFAGYRQLADGTMARV